MAACLSRTTSEVSGSIVSDTSIPIPPESLLDMEDEPIRQLIEQAELAYQTVEKEVNMFEKYLKRLDPKDIQGLYCMIEDDFITVISCSNNSSVRL